MFHSSRVVLFLFFWCTTLSSSSELSSLLLLRASVGGRTLLWNTSSPSPCSLQGVRCLDSRVVSLRLPGASLAGPIPARTLADLTALRTLSLRFNRLSGPFPPDLARLPELRHLFLQGNLFSGALPPALPPLVRLNLAANRFGGPLPPALANLTRLRTLYLEENAFAGGIPDFRFGSLQQFNVSFNDLNGSIPESLEGMPREAFLGNALCGKPLNLACGKDGKIVPPAIAGLQPNGGGGNGRKRRLSAGAIAGIVVACVLGLFFIVCVLCVLCRKKGGRGRKSRAVDVGAVKSRESDALGEKPMVEAAEIGGGGVGDGSNGFSAPTAVAAADTLKGASAEPGGKKLIFFGNAPRVFDLEDLLRASAEVLGKGTFGTGYKAVLEIGGEVAVKRLKDVVISENEFRERIEGVGAMDHENLVPLRAYYYSREEKLLVYDYMPSGSLSALLHGNKGSSKTPLNWEMRSGIALGAARGIAYLHSQGPNVSHGNIKSSNILLTKLYDARVSDFGLAQLVGPPSSPTRVAGYRAPEVTDQRKVSQKADVYSYGVLLLELLTGKAPTHALLNEEGVDLPRWVQSVIREEWSSEVFDLELLRYENVEEEMVQLLQLAVDCAAQFPDNRPSMSEVARRIEELQRSSVRGRRDSSDQIKETI